jgi:hypothetical protein
MAHKHLKNSGIAAIVLGCALGVAQAAGTTSPPIDPSQLRTLLKLKPGEPLPRAEGEDSPRVRPTWSVGISKFVIKAI